MDRFSFFFAFYGLILGLAVTELLGGFAGMVRAHALKKLEAQTALLALLVFISIVATWVDAWNLMRSSITLDFRNLWAPILLATFYYLAAAVVFPREHEQFADLHAYFAARKKFVIAMLWAALLLELYTYLGYFEDVLRNQPGKFWAWLLPWNLLGNALFLALMLVRGRRSNIALLVATIAYLMVPYWSQGVIDRLSMRLFGY